MSVKRIKNGLLSIEGEISGDNNLDLFIKKGLQMVVDGVEPQAANNAESGRAVNRRVDILIMNSKFNEVKDNKN
jgi:hypothetical protein